MRAVLQWLRPGPHLKRWLAMILVGITIISIGLAQLLIIIYRADKLPALVYDITFGFADPMVRAVLALVIGSMLFLWGILSFNKALLAPVMPTHSFSDLITRVHTSQQLRQGIRVVALGGGTGLPSVLRAMKPDTSNITAVVTMADDGGSSGRLRRSLGVQPPGDLRSNIVALAQDEDLMTRLFDYRFSSGELEGHSFGNLFLAAMGGLVGDMDKAAAATARILAIQGRVLPCTLEDVRLAAVVRHLENGEKMRVEGESNIPKGDWRVEQVLLEPAHAQAFPEVLQAIRQAEIIIIGPGSLYTSILPNLLAEGMTTAIRASAALKVYVCNIATQRGETGGFDVGDHIEALEAHVGQGLVDVVLANNHYPTEKAGPNTVYVEPASADHPAHQRYRVVYENLTDDEYPWRHSPEKLRKVLTGLSGPRPIWLNRTGKD